MEAQMVDELHIEHVYFSVPGDHEPNSEHNNQVIKEQVSTAYHGLPYSALPKQLVIYLVMESTQKINYFPTKNGICYYAKNSDGIQNARLSNVIYKML